MTRLLVATALSSVLLAGLGGWTLARTGSPQLSACADPRHGDTLHLLVGYACPPGERKVTWNIAGPPGPPGLVWRGTWSPLVSYRPGDAVYDPATATSWIAVKANAGDEPAPANPAWNVLAAVPPTVSNAVASLAAAIGQVPAGTTVQGEIGALAGMASTFDATPGRYLYTVPDGVDAVAVVLQGGGGCGGAAAPDDLYGGGGGGGGAFLEAVLTTVPGEVLTVTVGGTQAPTTLEDAYGNVLSAGAGEPGAAARPDTGGAGGRGGAVQIQSPMPAPQGTHVALLVARDGADGQGGNRAVNAGGALFGDAAAFGAGGASGACGQPGYAWLTPLP
jgi:hypothetical protein